MRGTMPAPDSSSSSAAPLSSIGRSLRSLRRDQNQNQIHSFPPPTPPHDAADAFQRRAAELLADLLLNAADPSDDDVLSLAWTRRLLDAFLLCLEEFRALLFGGSAPAAAARGPPLDRLVADFFDRAVKALDLCNAVRDGLDLVRQCRKHLAIAAAVLASSSPSAAASSPPPLGEAQIRRARKALTDLTILMLDDRDGGGSGVVGQRNRSFGRTAAAEKPPRGNGPGHHRRSSSGGSSGSGSGSHLRSLSWSVSRAWSAARQLQAIGGGLPVPRPHDNAATGGLANAVYTMGAVLFVVAFALVAAIPCQDRGLGAHLAVPRNMPCAGAVNALCERILDEAKRKERKNSCGLLREIHQMELCSRHLMEITDAAEFPLDEDKDDEVREAARELVLLCDSIKDGLDPLERQVREMFHRIVRTRTEILDCLSKPHAAE